MDKVKKQELVDEGGNDSPRSSFSSKKKQPETTSSDIISVKIKKSDNQIIKLTINLLMDHVIDIKEKVFVKEREEGKNNRLIF